MNPIKMGNRRLLKLADKLDTVEPEKFDYGHWVGDDWKGAQDLSCGTTACAFGWAPSIPAFQKAGLRLKRFHGTPMITIKYSRVKREDDERDDDAAAAIGHTLRTAQKFFSLSEEEANFLFVPSTSLGRSEAPNMEASAQDVARHIRKFVAKRVQTLKKDSK